MIQTTELRKGNWYQSEHSGRFDSIKVAEGVYYIQVNSIGSYCVNDWQDMGAGGRVECNDIMPIPLTEEILLKCGFKKVDDVQEAFSGTSFTSYCFIGFQLALVDDKWKLWIEVEDGFYNWAWTQLDYVHELQNLYYALNKKELEVAL